MSPVEAIAEPFIRYQNDNRALGLAQKKVRLDFRRGLIRDTENNPVGHGALQMALRQVESACGDESKAASMVRVLVDEFSPEKGRAGRPAGWKTKVNRHRGQDMMNMGDKKRDMAIHAVLCDILEALTDDE